MSDESNEDTGEVHVSTCLSDHISSVRCLALVHESPTESHLFSGGGRAQLKSWKIGVTHGEKTNEGVCRANIQVG